MKLTSLEKEDIEQVRLWRNMDHVKKHMLTQDEITPKMQLRWFNSLNECDDYYFVASKSGTKFGFASIKLSKKEKDIGEPGIYIGDPEFLNTGIGFKVVVLMNDYAFNVIGLKSLKATILDSNKAAIRFNKGIGYKKSDVSGDGRHEYTLSKEDYTEKRKKLMRIILQ